MHHYAILDKQEYFQELLSCAAKLKADDVFYVTSKDFDIHEPLVIRLCEQLSLAAKRGAKITILIDATVFLMYADAVPGPLFFFKRVPRILPKEIVKRREVIENLQAAGVEVVVSNLPKKRLSNPYAGRLHIKLAIHNDTVYIGGCNLNEVSQKDLMIKTVNATLASSLAKMVDDWCHHKHVGKAMHFKDVAQRIDANTTLLIDSGGVNQSIIYDTALACINKANTHILMTCQYFPNQATIEALDAAVKRGVQVTLVHNHSSKHSKPLNILHAWVHKRESKKRSAVLFEHELDKQSDFLHAKLLVIDEKTTLIGSHNFVQAGVRFGTAEIALQSTDPHFAKLAGAKICSLTGVSDTNHK